MLKLNVRVGQSVAVGGPTTIKIEAKSGQEIALIFDADRSIPIRIINDTPQAAKGAVGLGRGETEQSVSPGLGRNR